MWTIARKMATVGGVLAFVLGACSSDSPPEGLPAPPSPDLAEFEWMDPPKSDAELVQRLSDGGVSQHLIDEVVSIAEPAVILIRRQRGEASIPGGHTQVGGLPLLPPDHAWPRRDGFPLSLVAQLDLDALDGRAGPLLPDQGILQFYLDLSVARYTLNLDPVVLWFPSVEGLTIRTDGIADWGSDPILMDFEPIISVPLYGDRLFAHWPSEESDLYREAMAEPPTIDQVGGWPFEFQTDPVYWIALTEAGLDYSDVLPGEGWPADGTLEEQLVYNRRWTEAFRRLTDDETWRLLLQLEVTPGDSMWADGGNVWFMGQESRLIDRDFDDVRGELASH